MKPLLLLLLLHTAHICWAQPKITKLDKNTLPKTVEYTGLLITAVRWMDSLGSHIVLTTETGAIPSKTNKEEDYKEAALYAYHYMIIDDSIKLLWKVYDFVKECPLDIQANYIKNTFAVTDLNKNGNAEVWLMYKTACRSDVSPANMKIVMYEGVKKHIARGTNKVQVAEKSFTGGDYTFDAAFKSAPDAFKQYATQLWKKNSIETWD
jgi:hypothetical protein